MNGLVRAVPSLILILGSALTVSSCTDFDDARAEFCDNADPVSQKDVCGRGAVACLRSEDCPAPEGACFDTTVCEDGRCVPRPKAEEAPCSEPMSTQCFKTEGVCRSNVCVRPATKDEPCNDGSGCTDNDKCTDSGVCVGTSNCGEPPPCFQWADGCTSGACNLIRKPSGTICSDGNACTLEAKCNSAGECKSTATLACASTTPPICHEWAGTCSNKNCDFRPKSYRSECTDGNDCTEGDYCNGSGQCLGGGATQCPDRSSFCQQALGCEPNGGCQYRNLCDAYGPGYVCQGGACCLASVNVSTGLPNEEVCPVR
jgi:hypothetical protein